MINISSIFVDDMKKIDYGNIMIRIKSIGKLIQMQFGLVLSTDVLQMGGGKKSYWK
jgi:hypothetical protein